MLRKGWKLSDLEQVTKVDSPFTEETTSEDIHWRNELIREIDSDVGEIEKNINGKFSINTQTVFDI